MVEKSVQERLALLRDEVALHFHEHVSALELSLVAVTRGEHSALETLHRQAHSLAGVAGIYRLMQVFQAARKLEQIVAALPAQRRPNDDELLDMRQALAQLAIAVRQPDYSAELPIAQPQDMRRIVVVEDDAVQAGLIRYVLEHAGYQVEVFNELYAFREACQKQAMPAVVIMDMTFPEGEFAGARVIDEMKAKSLYGLQVIFLSGRSDMAAKLAAYRAGATRYLTKPVDSETLLQVVNESAALRPERRFRVLIADSEPDQLATHAQLLRQAGMEVREATDPLSVPQVLDSFAAEVLLLDMYMPQCSGPELAAILRDDARHASIPVVYLSAEADISRQLLALDRAGDYFLTKPVKPGHLVAGLFMHAKRYRQNNEQTDKLRAALYERERQQIAFDAHAIVSVTDAAGNITYANDKFCEISGYSREELLGSNHRIVKSGMHPPEFYADLWRTISSGKIWQGDISNKRKDGSPYWVETTIVPFLDDNGRPYQYISMRTDITRIASAVAMMCESELRLNRAQQVAHLGSFEWDLVSGELKWSDEHFRLWGLQPGSVTPSLELFQQGIDPDDLCRLHEALQHAMDNRKPFDFVYKLSRPDGSLHVMHSRGEYTFDGAGNAVKFEGTVQDITEHRRIEAELQIARDAAEFASRAKSEFMASMSHELRTPLNAILGFSQLFALDSQFPEEARNSAKEIERAGQHLLSLVNDIIDLGRIEAGRLELSMEPVPVKAVLEDSMSMMASLARNSGIDLTESGCGDVELVVMADYVRLRQVAINLLSNAIKYNRPQGKVHISCGVSEGIMRTSFSDTGPGIPRDKQSRIFNSFDRLGAERGKVEGTGIGLVITRSLVVAMGGNIGFESEMGKGSTFWVEFPLIGPVNASVPKQASASSPPPSIPPERTSGAKTGRPAVMYIEDNPMNMRLMQQILNRRTNVEMRQANSAELGIEMALANPPALIMMDINLAGMNGYQALAVLKADTRTAHIPVIAVSANAMVGDRERGLQAGFVDYLTKPLDVARMNLLIDQLLASRQSDL
ncbi:MAG: response regulator [Gallionella sp.]